MTLSILNVLLKESKKMINYISIDIYGIKPCIISTLKSKLNDKYITTNGQNDILKLKVPNLYTEKHLLETLKEFIHNLTGTVIHKLAPAWSFDEGNALIIGPDKINTLTLKEVLFLKMLLMNKKITTYNEMSHVLWKDREEVSKNAMRQFTKNFKKKLPPNTLHNIQSIGYKLIL